MNKGKSGFKNEYAAKDSIPMKQVQNAVGLNYKIPDKQVGASNGTPAYFLNLNVKHQMTSPQPSSMPESEPKPTYLSIFYCYFIKDKIKGQLIKSSFFNTIKLSILLH